MPIKERLDSDPARIFNACYFLYMYILCFAVVEKSKPFLSCELSQHLQFMYRIPKMANSIEDITGSGANITIKSWKYTKGPISLWSQSPIGMSIHIHWIFTQNLTTLNSEDGKFRIYVTGSGANFTTKSWKYTKGSLFFWN